MVEHNRGEVLVVDDDPELCDMLGLLLEASGFEVAKAPSGQSALAAIRGRSFDLVLVDLDLPMLRGTDVIAQAKALQPDLEAVVITGNSTFEAAVETLRAGAYDCIRKPFDSDHLVRVVSHAVERRRLRLTAIDHEDRVKELSTLHAQATLHAARLRAIHEHVRAINSEREVDAIVKLLAQRAAAIVDASHGAVLLPTADGAGLQMRALHGEGWGAPVGTISPIVGSLNGLVFRAGYPLISPQLSSDPRLYALMRERLPDGPAALIPLLQHGIAAGTLCVIDNDHARRTYSDDDLALLGLLAEHAALALDNARLHAMERAQNAALEARVDERTRALRDAQEQLVRKERLAILGRMAGSVSHEIRNPLSVLRNSLYFLRTLLASRTDDEAVRVIEVMESEVDRANGIVIDLLDYARVRAPVLRPVSLPALLSRALSGVSVPVGVSIVRDFAPDAPYAMADPDQLLTVFGNLVRNAIQAMGQGGTLTLRVLRDGAGVLAEVADTGPGIAPEIRARLFEPLITTKTKGLGLGLATAKNLVEIQQGTLTVDSASAPGARFRVLLSSAPATPAASRPQTNP